MRRAFPFIACLLVGLAAKHVYAERTHVHVLSVDINSTVGSPVAGLLVYYELPNGKRELLGPTEANGIADGEVDVTKIGRTLNLYVVGRDEEGNQINEVKEVTWESPDELEKGFAISLVRTAAASETISAPAIDTMAASQPFDEMDCPPCFLPVSPRYYYCPPGYVYPTQQRTWYVMPATAAPMYYWAE